MASWRMSLPAGIGLGGASSNKRRSVAGNGERNALREALRNRGGAKAAVPEAVTECEDNEDRTIGGPMNWVQNLRRGPLVSEDSKDDSSPFANSGGAGGLGWLNLEAFSPAAMQKTLEKLGRDAAGGLANPQTLIKQADEAITGIRGQPIKQPGEQMQRACMSPEREAADAKLAPLQAGLTPRLDVDPTTDKASAAAAVAATASVAAPKAAAAATSAGGGWFSNPLAAALGAVPASPSQPARKSSGGGLRSTLAARGGVVRRPSADPTDATAAVEEAVQGTTSLSSVVEETPRDVAEERVPTLTPSAAPIPVADSIADPVADPIATPVDAEEVAAPPAVAAAPADPERREGYPADSPAARDQDATPVANAIRTAEVSCSSPSEPAADASDAADDEANADGHDAAETWRARKLGLTLPPRRDTPPSPVVALAEAANKPRPPQFRSVDPKAWMKPVEKAAPDVEDPKDVKRGQFRDLKEFWGKSSKGFAGPSMGESKISVVEAQATLQRLMSAGRAVDFDHVRRLRKQISELEAM